MSSDKNETSLSVEDIARPLGQTLTTAFGVAGLLYPIQVIQSRMQTGKPFTFSALFLMNFQPLFRGLKDSCKASLMKNSVLSNRETVGNHVNNIMEKPQAETQTLHQSESSKVKNFSSTFITSMIIGGLDAVSNNYFSNRATKCALGKTLPPFTLKDKLKFARLGLHIQFARNSINAFFCIGTNTIIKGPVDEVLPAHQYSFANHAVSNILAGAMGGVGVNFANVIKNNMINEANLETLKAPSAWETTKKIFKEGGIRAFFKGSLLSVAMTCGAYVAINSIDHYYNNVWFPKKNASDDNDQNQFKKNASTFFQSQPVETIKIEELSDVNESNKKLSSRS